MDTVVCVFLQGGQSRAELAHMGTLCGGDISWAHSSENLQGLAFINGLPCKQNIYLLWRL